LLGEAREIIEPCHNPGPVIIARLERTERSPRRASLTQQPTRGEPPELSERELAVLRLLASPLSQREIGNELYVSLNTVKTHTRHIFRKLGVSSRDEATERARVLGLLS
jgi:LuxR family transcriptional regulator, maltose regulon positive regulatory protein